MNTFVRIELYKIYTRRTQIKIDRYFVSNQVHYFNSLQETYNPSVTFYMIYSIVCRRVNLYYTNISGTNCISYAVDKLIKRYLPYDFDKLISLALWAIVDIDFKCFIKEIYNQIDIVLNSLYDLFEGIAMEEELDTFCNYYQELDSLEPILAIYRKCISDNPAFALQEKIIISKAWDLICNILFDFLRENPEFIDKKIITD